MHAAFRKICLLLVPLSFLALGGCASQSEVDSLRSELIKTQKAAEAAKADRFRNQRATGFPEFVTKRGVAIA